MKIKINNNPKIKIMKTVNYVLITLIFSFLCLGTKVQGLNRMDTMPFQVSFITPLGTNGLNSWNVVNKVSFNIYGGYAGGLDGFEASGFFSVLRGDMNGAQFSGFVNADLGNSTGGQFAGFVNYNRGTFEGAQFAGFVNVTSDNTEGAQLAGFTNVVVGELNGTQMSGFVNAVTAPLDGFQASGFLNYAQGISMGQVSGMANMNVGDFNGLQAAGLFNVNTHHFKGVQLSGLVNIANKFNGLQLGVFNYIDSLESGTPIGFLSIVRNGYHTFELNTNESLYGTASFKTGTRKFYNIFSAGLGVQNEDALYGLGYGVGTLIGLSNKTDLGIEAISYHIYQDTWDEYQLNQLNKLNILVNYQLTPAIVLFGGPSFNVVVSDTEDENGEVFTSQVAPYNFFSETYSNKTKVEMYAGLTLGVRF